MNNLNLISIRSANFSESCGFTEVETMQMLADYGMLRRKENGKAREYCEARIKAARKTEMP